jgi:hypothetical protein
VLSHQKISESAGNFTPGNAGGILDDVDYFGISSSSLGDLDNDGIVDIVVGANRDDDGGTNRGAVYILFLNGDGTVKNQQKISDTAGNFTPGNIGGTLDDFDYFGTSVSSIGDLDGDGVTDIAVGAVGDDDGGDFRGAVYILFLNNNGTVKSHQKISDTAGNFTTSNIGGTLDDHDDFGDSVASLDDLDGDGITDIVVGAIEDDDGGTNNGAVYILFLNNDGTVKAQQKISELAGNFTLGNAGGTLNDADFFGQDVANIGDLDRDEVTDIVVGADGDDDGGSNRGAVYILFLNSNGTVKNQQKISDTAGNFTPGNVGGTLDQNEEFGHAVTGVGDLNGDSILDIAVGANRDDDGGFDNGALYNLFLKNDGTVMSKQKISELDGNFTPGNNGGILEDGDRFGFSVSNLGDLDGDGITELASGAIYDDDGGVDNGAVWILFLDGLPPPVADAGQDKTICAGQSASIGGSPTASGGTPPYTFSWTPTTGLNDPTIAKPTASPATTTTYTVTVTDSKGKTAMDDVTVTVNPTPTADADADATICFGQTVTLGGAVRQQQTAHRRTHSVGRQPPVWMTRPQPIPRPDRRARRPIPSRSPTPTAVRIRMA